MSNYLYFDFSYCELVFVPDRFWEVNVFFVTMFKVEFSWILFCSFLYERNTSYVIFCRSKPSWMLEYEIRSWGSKHLYYMKMGGRGWCTCFFIRTRNSWVFLFIFYYLFRVACHYTFFFIRKLIEGLGPNFHKNFGHFRLKLS